MVAGFHLIWTIYGYWLPNDIRGSTSREIRVELIRPLGEIHFGRKKNQPSSKEIGAFQEAARDLLKHPVLTLDDEDITLVGKIIGQVIAAQKYTCYACAVMPDHVHLLIRRHRDKAETMIEHFQETTRTALIDSGKRAASHPVWTKGPGWKGFLNTRGDFERDIKYILQNPDKIDAPDKSPISENGHGKNQGFRERNRPSCDFCRARQDWAGRADVGFRDGV